MPRLHRKIISGRFFVLSSFQGQIVTYQTKWTLHQRFCEEGRKKGDKIEQHEVIQLVKSGELYTKGLATFNSAPHPELPFESDLPPQEHHSTQALGEPSSANPFEDVVTPIPDACHDRAQLKIILIALAVLAAAVLWVLSGA